MLSPQPSSFNHPDGRIDPDVGHILRSILAPPPIRNVALYPLLEGDGRGVVGQLHGSIIHGMVLVDIDG
jgi:hypothetical protein